MQVSTISNNASLYMQSHFEEVYKEEGSLGSAQIPQRHGLMCADTTKLLNSSVKNPTRMNYQTMHAVPR